MPGPATRRVATPTMAHSSPGLQPGGPPAVHDGRGEPGRFGSACRTPDAPAWLSEALVCSRVLSWT